ncbi:YicC/YloC family endoribonuclease [Piscinibacter sakaiensis]|uniref:YicC/YloC family endoribonuclease n=1 Tax=Piscinibacter sakaiensis TaxID=1547922 RepID=UPI003AACC240
MPVYSMTGYASASSGAAQAAAEHPDSKPESSSHAGAPATSLSVELRSVNGRFLDLSFRLPDELRMLEPALRELIGGAFRRGKIELRLSTRTESEQAWPQPQPAQLGKLAQLQDSVLNWLPKAAPLSVNEVLHWCKGAAAQERLDETALAVARQAIDGLKQARRREGEKLVAVLLERVQTLRDLADRAEPLVPEVVQRQQQKFLDRWRDALETTGAAQTIPQQALQERALNEAAAYAIRIDVAEELARLRAHLDEITRLLDAGGEVGKRLDFLIQELLREANTLASKAASLELINTAVEMKVAIEQMREQVQNLE